jgi:hypothetical protein
MIILATQVAKAYGISKSAIVTGSAIGLTLLAAFNDLTAGKTILVLSCSAISACIVAYFKHQPATIAAVSAAKIAQSELLGRQAAGMIARLESKLEILVESNRLQTEARHDIAGYLSPLQHNFDLVCELATEAGVKNLPELPDIAGKISKRVRQLDDDLKAIPKPKPLIDP